MLYNTHLATLIEVVEAGSFRRAADNIGISPSAVLKQITLLEQEMEISLFDRSRKGVTLTEAGESLYRDAKYIMKYCDSAVDRARELFRKQTNIIRISVSPLSPATPLVDLWPVIQRACPDLQCRFSVFDSSEDGADRAISTLGQDSEILLSVYDEQFLKHYNVSALKLMDTPVVIGESVLSADARGSREKLEITDLYDRTVLLPREGLLLAADRFRRDVEQHPRIRIEDFDMYSLDVFYRCQSGDRCVFTYDVWQMGNILLRQTPVNWDYASSYGILYAKEPSENVVRIIEAVKAVLPGVSL